MARHFITNIEYTPYTFQEMWQPAEYATKVHHQQAMELATMGDKAQLLGAYVDPERDSEEYQAYNNYMRNIRSASDDLLSNGLSTNSLNNMYAMSSLYNRDIKPIEVSVQNKQEYIKSLQDVAKNPTNLLIKDASDYSLRDYKNGVPTVEYIDAKDVAEQATKLAQADAKNMVNILPPVQYDRFNQIVYEKHGLTLEQAVEGLQDPKSKINFLKDLILSANGAERLLMNGKIDNFQRLDQLVNKALIEGSLGEIKTDIVDNGYYKSQKLAQGWKSIALQEAELQRKIAKDIDGSVASQISNGMVTKHTFVGQTDMTQRWFQAAGPDAKKWQQSLYSILSTTNGGNKKVKVFKEDGGTTKLDLEKELEGKNFSITFPGKIAADRSTRNARECTNFLINIDGKKYYVTPEQLGLPTEVIKDINNVFGRAIVDTAGMSPEQINQLHMQRAIVAKHRANPEYLTPEEDKMLQSMLDQYTAIPATQLYNMAKYNSSKYNQE